jgi:hypothetical protein
MSYALPILFVLGAYVALPAVLVLGWVRWFRRGQTGVVWPSLVGFSLGTASALLAGGAILYARAAGGSPFYDPSLLRIYRWGPLQGHGGRRADRNHVAGDAASCVELVATSADKSMTDAIAFLLAHKNSRQEHLSIVDQQGGQSDTKPAMDLSFVAESWWPLVAPEAKPSETPTHVARRWFELCVITQVMQELKSADLCIPGSDRYSDFREQFVSEEECQQQLQSYGERAGIPTEPKAFVSDLQRKLEESSTRADQGFPENEYLRIEKGEAILKRLRRAPDPVGLHILHHRPRRRGNGDHLELPRHHAARPSRDLGGLAKGPPPDPSVQVVELARQL